MKPQNIPLPTTIYHRKMSFFFLIVIIISVLLRSIFCAELPDPIDEEFKITDNYAYYKRRMTTRTLMEDNYGGTTIVEENEIQQTYRNFTKKSYQNFKNVVKKLSTGFTGKRKFFIVSIEIEEFY